MPYFKHIIFGFALLVSPKIFAIEGGSMANARSVLTQSAISLGEFANGKLTRSFCSGVIVSERTIVTAAHCLYGKDATKIVVLFGENGNTTGQMRAGSKIDIPSGYQTYNDRLPNARDNFDIAVLRFTGGLPRGFKAARMVAQELTTEDQGATISIGGFGLPEKGILSSCSVQVMNTSFSNSEFELTSSPACTPDSGDSGGPDFSIYQGAVALYGIHNWGWHDSSGKPNMSVEVKISFYAPWILSLSQ